MEGGFFDILINLLIGSSLLIGLGLIPGLALIRILDPGADKLRQVMLAPAASLLILFGLSGWLVVLRGVHSVEHLVLMILVVNIVAATIGWQRDVVRVRRLSAWERLEEIAEAAEAEGGTVDLEGDVAAEKQHSAMVATGRPEWLPWALAISALICATPLFILERPMGVDWLGFATLSHRLAETGSMALPEPNLGRWTYPPAFPALAAFLEQATGMPSSDCIQLLGHLSLFAVIWGVAGAADRWGASATTLLALCLAPALFAKSFDSGYPTVASQLGLVLGLLVLVKPPRERSNRMDLLFAFGVAFVGVIHPTGSLYLGTLLLAWLGAHRFSAQNESSHTARLAIISTIVVGGAVVIVMGVFAPRMLDTPVWAEYGWQGGLPLLLYNGPILLGLAFWALYRFRNSFEVWLLGLWVLLQWSLTSIHIFDGLVGIPLLTLMSYMLYSMALHGFHIPLAVLAGIILAKVPRITPRLRERTLNENHVEEEIVADGAEMSMIELEIPNALDKRPIQAMLSIALVAILIAHVVMIQISNNPELEVQTPGDRFIQEKISMLPDGSVIFTEKAHWGILYEIPSDLGVTGFPTLGLLTIEENVHSVIERAIIQDDISILSAYGITHAFTSPRGQIIHILAQSEHWTIVEDKDGSRLWEFTSEQNQASLKYSEFVFPSQSNCLSGCEWRIDPWYHADSAHLKIRNESIPYFTNGATHFDNISLPKTHRDTNLMIQIQHSGAPNINIYVEVCDSGTNNCSTITPFKTKGGHEATRILHHSDYRGEIEIYLSIEGGGDSWINPAGLSGRSDRIVDEDGAWLHWIEVREL